MALEHILAAPSPAAAKRLGRGVRAFDEERWNAQRFAIVVAGNEHKFRQHEPLAAFLRATQPRVLVEASPVMLLGHWAREGCVRGARPVALAVGLNLLGFALMEVRERL